MVSIQHSEIRLGIDNLDTVFVTMRKALKAANKDWKQDISHPFYVWDKRNTLAASQKQFEVLYGFLNHLYTIVFHLINVRDGYPVPVEEYKILYDTDNIAIEDNVLNAKNWIKDTATTYNIPIATIKTKLINVLENQFGFAVSID